jgi:predicted DNA-binding transcriptional regulator AlpA
VSNPVALNGARSRIETDAEIVMLQHTNELQREGLTVPEACHVLGIKRTKLFDLMKTGAIARRKIGKRTIIHIEDCRRLLASSIVAGEAA